MKRKISIRNAEIIIILVIIAAILLPQLIGTVSKSKVRSSDAVVTLEALNGKTFAAVTGASYENYIKEYFPASHMIYVADRAGMEQAVIRGDADAFITEGSSLDEMLSAHEELIAHPIPVENPTFLGEGDESMYAVLRRSDAGFQTTGKTMEDMEGTDVKIAGVALTDPVYIAQKLHPQATFQEYNSLAEVYYAVSSGKADFGLSYADNFPMIEDSYDNLAFIREPLARMDYAFAMQKTEEGAALRDEYNVFFRELKETGKFDAILEKWHSGDSELKKMDTYSYSGEKGTLKIATGGTWEPYSYYVGSELSGEMIEFTCLFCQQAGYIPEFYVVPYASEITGLLSGEYDLLADAITITEERQENSNLTDSFLSSYTMVLTRVDEAEQGTGTVPKASVFFSGLKTSFEKNFLRESRWKMILSGLGVTVALAVMAGVAGTALGCGICAMRMSRKSFLTGFARIYIKLIQGTPIVVLLMVLYYVVFGNADIKAFWICALGFSLDFAAYASEIFRSGVEAVPEGQKRAAKALGFSRTKAFTKVVLPQAMIHILPVYSGQFIATVKLTSVAGYISVQDLTKISDIIRSRTYEAFFPLITTAVIYFVIAALLVSLLKVAERRIDPALRSREIKGVNIHAD